MPISHPETYGSSLPSADAIDCRLHAERVGPDGTKRLFQANVGEMPNGVFVRRANWGEVAYLIWNGGLHAWSARGYKERIAFPKKAKVSVLTPESTVAAIRAGYALEIHPSAVALA